MKNSERKRIYRMEVEDDLGIKRGIKKAFNIPVKLYIIIKVCLIVSLPLVYFICSPLLILVVGAYFGFMFITNSVERNMNRGLKKELHVRLPKADSILCLLLIIITLTGVVVSSVSTTERKSPFEGMESTKVEEFKNIDFSSAEFKWMRIKTKLKDIGTLMTGTRYFFQSERQFGGPNGFKLSPQGEDFSPPINERPDMSEILENMPFEMLFTSIIRAVDTGMLVVICLSGILSFRKIKKEMQN